MAGVLSFVVVFITAALVTAGAVPLASLLATRLGAVAEPDVRRVHEWATPVLGGLGMLVGFVAAMAVAWRMEAFDRVFANSTEIQGVILAAVVIYLVGMIDDVRELTAPAKIAGMVLAGSVLTVAGVSILYLRIPFAGFIVLSPDLSALITVLWVIGMANAVNLIDGLDGLAAGIVGIAAAAFYLYSTQLHEAELLRADNIAPLLAVAVAGICAGFLPHNIHPARTFMGDGGALLLGLLMAAATMAVGGRTADQFSGQTYFFFAPLFIPLFILGVPILDTLFAIIRRARNRSGLATADKGHLHHRLMNLGHGQRRSVFILWTWTALLSAFVLYPTFTGKGDAIVPIGCAALGLLLYTWFSPGIRRTRAMKEEQGRALEERSGRAPAEQDGGDGLRENAEVGRE